LLRRFAPRNDTTSVVLLILVTTALRLAFGATLGLGVDESYMVASGRVLSLAYYDHPPAAWWLSWAAAHLLGSEAPIAVRLPFIALFALSTWLMYRLGAAVADERAGLWAAVLLNMSPVFGITTGSWVLPDGPLDCALLGAALCFIRALDRRALGWWLGAGAWAGLALLSKYSALLTLAGAGLYLLSNRQHRHWLTTPKPWLALLMALLIFAPVLAWNAVHGWVSFAFQAGRAAGMHLRPIAPLETLAGEALFVLPWIWLPMMAVLVVAVRRGRHEWRSWLLCCLAAPAIVFFAAVSAWSSQRVLLHWAAPGYLMLFPLLGAAIARRINLLALRLLLAGTAVLAVLGMAVVATQVRFDWLHSVIAAVARRDPDVEAVDWTSLRDLVPPGSIVGVPDWRDAGKIAYALGPDVTVLCLSRDARQFGLVQPAARFVGADILILAPEHGERVADELAGAFDSIEKLSEATIRHAGRSLARVTVFEARGLRGWPPPS
jgi:4-amino-4-deoxy-L-arabinose transferase-like glycosyltransferase